MSIEDIINKESLNFQNGETFIVNYYNEFGYDFDEELEDFRSAIKFLLNKNSIYLEESGSMYNLTSEPTLHHPYNDDSIWSIESNEWIDI